MISTETQHKNGLLEKKIIEVGNKVGHTPLHRISPRLYNHAGVTIFAKKEWLQIGGSVKARAAYQIIRHAIENGSLDHQKILLDATSGNTGIAYASIAREIGLRVSLCLPENASLERKQILRDLGVDIIYTSALDGTDGSQQLAQELAAESPGKYFYADQYKNENNWRAHYYSTAVELMEEVPGITHFATGLGTTGTFIGTGRRLKEWKSSIQLVAFHPDSALHGMEGWKHLETAVVPTIYDASVADDNMEISTEEAYAMLQQTYEIEGLLLSPSSAANIAGAVRLAQKIDSGTIVTVLPDNADKYSEVINKLIRK